MVQMRTESGEHNDLRRRVLRDIKVADLAVVAWAVSASRDRSDGPIVSGGLGVLTSVKSACDSQPRADDGSTHAFEDELALPGQH